jgi:hypothetical protein
MSHVMDGGWLLLGRTGIAQVNNHRKASEHKNGR